VEIRADIGWKGDYHRILSFEVLNPNMKYTFSGDRFFLGEEQEKREGKPYLDLGLEITNSSNDIPRFPPGGIIRGKLKAENCDMKKAKKAKIQLSSIERSHTNIMMESIKKEIKYDEDDKDNTIAFEIQILHNAKRSYNDRSDIHANRIIQVI
jgi:hypothetical protein